MTRWSTLIILAAAACAPAAPPAPGPVPAPTEPAAVGAAPAPERAAARVERPIPDTVRVPAEFRAAMDEGTRTRTGRPGPRYWQNWTDYRLQARLLPESRRLEGSAEIRYHNRSPDELPMLMVDLVQNFHAPGVPRLEQVEVTGGVSLARVTVAGRALRAGVEEPGGYVVEGTKLMLYPAQPVRPGSTVELAIDWAFTIPAVGAGGRMGHSQDNLFFLAYFYPQMAVYDDVVGWHPDPFLGTAEFYSGFGNYQVTVDAPAGWLVMGTGELTNAQEVLSDEVLSRLRAAERSDSVMQVLSPAQAPQVTRARTGRVRWTFRADSVRDVAYSATRASAWDAASTTVGDRNGDGQPERVRVDAIYRPAATRWRNAARYAQHAVRFLSGFTGYPYPWSHMSAVEGAGIIGGGMEYPMMTLMGDYTAAGDAALYNVTAHEIAHMWVPMIIGTDERRYAWVDEGTTNFNENQANKQVMQGPNPELADRAGYLRVAQRGEEGEVLRRSDYHYPGNAYVVATYYKPSTLLATLRGLLGEETFLQAYRELWRRWAFKHMYPWDMWNTFEDVSGRDLDWFWHSWYAETWQLDQAVASVTARAGETEIVVRDLGDAPMPARLTITLAGGERVQREIPVDSWLSGVRTATVRVPGSATRVEIDAENAFPDADRTNNVWPR